MTLDERAALRVVGADVSAAGDDCAVVGETVISTDMLHETTDFPGGTTRYTAGWRAVGASLSDVAAMGATATAAVAVYGAPTFEETALREFLRGAREVCEAVGAEYVGGDLDAHQEFTVATTAVGDTDAPVRRSGARAGDAVCVTGAFGRSAAAVRAFRAGDAERGNDLFRFVPRVAEGVALRPHATAMMDSSDGLARSLHQLSEASGVGVDVELDRLPVHGAVADYAADETDARELSTFFGEDFELVCTIPEGSVPAATDATATPLTRIGRVTEAGVVADGAPLEDRGYSH